MYEPLPRFRNVEDRAFIYASRVIGWAGTPVTQSDVASIGYKVFDKSDDDTSSGTGALAVATSIYNALQTWSKDATGYNAKFVIPGTCFPTGKHLYQVEITLTMAAGDSIPLEPFEVYVVDRIG